MFSKYTYVTVPIIPIIYLLFRSEYVLLVFGHFIMELLKVGSNYFSQSHFSRTIWNETREQQLILSPV